MALTKEQLTAKGIDEETATKVLSAVDSLFKDVLNNNYVSKETFNAVNTKKNELQGLLNTADAEVKRLTPFEQQVTDLNNTITELKTANTDLQTKYDNQATVLQQENLVKNALMEVVVDIDDVFPKLDMSKIVFNEGKIQSGLNEQLETIKQSKPHYFKNQWDPKNNFFGFSPKDGSNTNKNAERKDVAFARELAKGITSQTSALQKANDVYFKGGIN